MAEIKYQDSSCPMFYHEVDDRAYRFSMASIPQDHWDWFAGVLGRQMDEIAELAYNKGRSDVQNEMKTALGIK